MPDLISSLISDPQALSDLLASAQPGGRSMGTTAGGGIPFPTQAAPAPPPQAPPQQAAPPDLTPPPGSQAPLRVPQIAPQATPPPQPDHQGFASKIGNIFRTLSGAKGGEMLRQMNTDMKIGETLIAQGTANNDPELTLQGVQMLAKHGGKPAKDFLAEQQRRADLHVAGNQPQIQVPDLTPPPSAGGFASGQIGFTPEQAAVRGVNAQISAANAMAPLNQQQLQLAMARLKTMGIPVEKLDPEQIADYVTTGKIPYAPTVIAPQGSRVFTATGRQVGQGEPKPIDIGPGHTIGVLTPPPGTPTAPQLGSMKIGDMPSSVPAPQVPQFTQVASGGPEPLNPAEAGLLSAAQQVAQAHNLPFDPNKNPRNPFAQIPVRYQAEVRARDAEEKMDPVLRATTLAMRNSMEGLRQVQEQNARYARADRSYAAERGEIDKLATPVTQLVARMGRLKDALATGTPVSDALVGPELLSVMAGGQGTGMRMTEPELTRIFGGRSGWEDIRAKIQHWNTDPAKANSITPVQRQQINQLVDTVDAKLKAKQSLIDEGYNTLLGSENPNEHRAATVKVRRGLTAIDQGQTPAAVPGLTPPPGTMISVQIPGHPPGQIPASAKDQFLRDNPGAKVVSGGR